MMCKGASVRETTPGASLRPPAIAAFDARGAVAFIEAEDAVGLVCWLFGPELLKKNERRFS